MTAPRVLLLALITSSACAPAAAAPTGIDALLVDVAPGDRPACSFYWRKSVSHSHTAEKHVPFDAASGSFALETFDVDWTVGPSDDGGRVLALTTMVGDTRVRSEYDFGSANAPAHLPRGGHGFTGLRYLTNPSTEAEMQFFCGAYAEDTPFENGVMSQRTPGKGVEPPADIACEFTATGPEGKTKTRAFEVQSGDEKRLESLGPFVVAVRYDSAGADSGGVVVDVGEPGDEDSMPAVHTLYQLSAPELPANTMKGESFTGAQSLEKDGHQIAYRCWTSK